MKNRVFALDIGTQSVTGILLEKREHTYKIIDYCVKQHPERAMLDGQIQNVVQVAEVICEVMKELEKNYGTLTKVCVAAAGRALKTVQAKKTVHLHEHPITSEEEVRHIELSAVQQALLTLTEENDKQFSHYHCVGYSVLHYELDGDKIGSFIDQVGEEAAVEVIATFLPKVVVESLRAALERAGLTMEALTLEPIAAIHVLVPESMRRLNIALIDIGAGTSDIAITKDGTVTAYGMVPVAGDEITEAISDHCLLDFKIAEKTKRQIVLENEATVQDILGFETTITYEELLPHITNSIDNLAQLLAQEVKLLNGKEPQAIMLIGGGSLTPKINEKIAENLQLPINRVAIRGIDAIQLLEEKDNLPAGPDFVTPIGIAISATENPLHYVTVYVNEKVTFMFETKQLTVGDALIHAGIDINNYYGKIGLAKIVQVNGHHLTLRGSYGEPPKIYVNDEKASIDSLIQAEDRISISKGANGCEPQVTIEELVGASNPITISINNNPYHINPVYLVNGVEKNKNYPVQDKDKITVNTPNTMKDVLELAKDSLTKDIAPLSVNVNGRRVHVKQASSQILLNGVESDLHTLINDGDSLNIKQAEQATVRTLLHQLKKEKLYKVTVMFNGKPIELIQQQLEIKRNNVQLQETDLLHNGDKLILTEKKVRPFIFQDVFRFVDINPASSKGTYKLFKNRIPTAFHEEIIHGDQLELIWENEHKKSL